MKIGEVSKWHPFVDSEGTVWDLSFLDAHEAIFTHKCEEKKDRDYKFIVSYSSHCFCKDYPEQTELEKQRLMYPSPRESRPFCKRRYLLAQRYLKNIILTLDKQRIIHAGYGSYAVLEVLDEESRSIYYHVPFKVFRENKKFRLHITSAYPVMEKPGGKKVGFYVIAYNLAHNKPLPHP
ncbi:stationary phase growth adaptation protein [Erwinia sp. DT-104]|uniref:stationary phase growth adaptation protein n=1 Tax=Erwinia sp. DT-104 TaxID=3396161 RepID=UPI003F1C5E74